MQVEDLVISLALSTVATNRWDRNIVDSFYDQISQGRGLTEKQGILAVKIIRRYSDHLSTFLQKDLTLYLDNPSFRLGVRQVNNDKKISIIVNDTYGKCIQVNFPYKEEYITKIRKSREEIDHCQWDKNLKSWIFVLSEKNINFLLELTKDDEFSYDSEFEYFVKQHQSIVENFENYVPLVTLQENRIKFYNFDEKFTIFPSNDVKKAIFEARKKGILTWDETVSNFIDSDSMEEVTRLFVKNDPGSKFYINSQIYPISSVKDIVCHLSPALFIIPGGSEFEKLLTAYNFLVESGFLNNEMSVMFRLPNKTHENFNDFVKTQHLNNSIHEKTKIVFVSGKLPKPVLSSKIKFHSIINLGTPNCHYSLRDYIKFHENLVVYTEEPKQKELNFAFM